VNAKDTYNNTRIESNYIFMEDEIAKINVLVTIGIG
jgi:hypothetical protein